MRVAVNCCDTPSHRHDDNQARTSVPYHGRGTWTTTLRHCPRRLPGRGQPHFLPQTAGVLGRGRGATLCRGDAPRGGSGAEDPGGARRVTRRRGREREGLARSKHPDRKARDRTALLPGRAPARASRQPRDGSLPLLLLPFRPFMRLRRTARRTARSVPARARSVAAARDASCSTNTTLGRSLSTTLTRQA